MKSFISPYHLMYYTRLWWVKVAFIICLPILMVLVALKLIKGA